MTASLVNTAKLFAIFTVQSGRREALIQSGKRLTPADCQYI
jgi:hypothetical protein